MSAIVLNFGFLRFALLLFALEFMFCCWDGCFRDGCFVELSIVVAIVVLCKNLDARGRSVACGDKNAVQSLLDITIVYSNATIVQAAAAAVFLGRMGFILIYGLPVIFPLYNMCTLL